jgi:hypothetical protein
MSRSPVFSLGDYEIFDLVDELEKIEGKEVDFYTWLNIEVGDSFSWQSSCWY